MHGQPGGYINEAPAQQPRARKQQPWRHRLGPASQVLANGLATTAEQTGQFGQVKQPVAVCPGFDEIGFLSQVRTYKRRVGLASTGADEALYACLCLYRPQDETCSSQYLYLLISMHWTAMPMPKSSNSKQKKRTFGGPLFKSFNFSKHNQSTSS